MDTIVRDETHDIDSDIRDDEVTSAAKSYTIRDYFDIRIDEFTGQLRNTFTCPRGDTQCDGFAFDSIQDCLDHESDWHSGPYKCFICGQGFASGPRLRRHEHYTDSEERRAEAEAAETRKDACYGIKIYHGNGPARRRAKLLLKKLQLEEAVQKQKRDGKIVKDVEKEMARKRKREGGPLVVIGMVRGTVMGEVEDEKGGGNCDEPCCPAFERRFVNDKAHQRHVASQGHVAAMRMGAALVEQLATMAGFKTSLTETRSRPTNVDMSGRGHDRDTTPPPSRLVGTAQTQQLLSPPATPHGPSSSLLLSRDEEETSWDSTEHIPLRLERRLALTQQALRELRCNAPGCGLYRKQMASSQSYWGHLASEGHVEALKTWSEGGGEAVYVHV